MLYFLGKIENKIDHDKNVFFLEEVINTVLIFYLVNILFFLTGVKCIKKQH
jgi:uncharacterized membrane-anchored protein YitT (DUF2179 family)